MRSPEDLALIAAIADDLAAGVWVATVPEGKFVYSNRAFEEIMGTGGLPAVAAGEYAQPYGIYGRDGNLYPESRMPFVRALNERATVVVDDIVIHRRDGRRIYVRAFAKPMLDGAGGITHIAIAFFDITREVDAELARSRAELQLAQAERLASVGMLAAGVAHEINNPLAYVMGNLDLIADQLSAKPGIVPDVEGLLRDARQGAERVRSIVRDLKLFSRVQEDKPAPVDVGAAIESAVALAHNEIRHRARLVMDLLPVPAVLADQRRLSQIFLNLLINAAQAIPEGAADKNEIRIVTRPAGDGWVCVEVKDTGGGIPREDLPRIFDPFFTTKAVGVGTGLGLSIVHAIVTAVGGRIEVESVPGAGSTFRVLLPPALEVVAPAPVSAAQPAVRGKRGAVLVIDDEPLILKVVKSLLAPDHEVTCEARAADALERIRRGERFDVILCDLMMPEVTGINVYESLRQIAPQQAAAMVFLTGGAFTPGAQRFLERITNTTIEKPFDGTVLREAVRKKVGEA